MSISLPKERKERSRASRGPLRVVDDFDAAWNAHDEEEVLELFTDDAVATFSLSNETLGRMRASGEPA